MRELQNMSNTAILSVLQTTAQAAAILVKNQFRSTTNVTDKSSHQDIVTQTDLESQQLIHSLLLEAMQKMGIDTAIIGFVEEESTSNEAKEHTFIIDPIDGTTNFAAGIPFSCISIAYAFRQTLQIGVVIEPFTGTIFWGVAGEGAWVENSLLGKRVLQLSPKSERDWVLGAHLNNASIAPAQFELYQKIYPRVRAMRNLGSLTLDLCYQADNVLDVVFNRGCYFWDIAAASVILSQAGGQLYDLNGQPLKFDWQNPKLQYQLFACHPSNAKAVLSYLE